MKNLSFILVVLLAVFSKVIAQSPALKETVATPNGKLIRADFMFGEWTRCAFAWKEHKRVSKTESVDTQHEITANVCPVIAFNTNFTGYFKLADGSVKHFKWQLAANNLTVLNSGDWASSVLKNGVYKVVVHPEELDYNKVVLISSQGVSHFLVK
jgi:hypothetical protein